MNVFCLANLGGEVSVENAFGVQIGQTAGDVTAQLDSGGPTQVFVAVQKLLQVPTIDVLQTQSTYHTKHVYILSQELQSREKMRTPSVNLGI